MSPALTAMGHGNTGASGSVGIVRGGSGGSSGSEGTQIHGLRLAYSYFFRISLCHIPVLFQTSNIPWATPTTIWLSCWLRPA
jgi:hypothetical protein